MRSFQPDNRSIVFVHLLSYGVMILWCVWLLQRAILLPASEPLYIFGSGILILRAIQYLYGVLRRNADLQFSFYGLEYCGAGYLISRFGGPLPLVILLFLLGLCMLIIQCFRSPAAKSSQQVNGP